MEEQREFSTISLPNNVQDAMRDNLPGQISKILRDELERGAAAIAENADLKEEIKKVERNLDRHGEIKSAERSLKNREKNCKDAEEGLAERQHELSLTIKEHQLEIANKYAAKLETVLAGLVRNQEWRESVFKGHTDEYGANGEIRKVEISRDTTSTAE